MTEGKLTTICFMGTEAIKAWLERWAAEDERSVSYILRQILKREIERQEQVQPIEKKSINQQTY
jgi:hypothetical protein